MSLPLKIGMFGGGTVGGGGPSKEKDDDRHSFLLEAYSYGIVWYNGYGDSDVCTCMHGMYDVWSSWR